MCSIMERWIWVGWVVEDGCSVGEVSKWVGEGRVSLWLDWVCGGITYSLISNAFVSLIMS